MRYSCFFVFGGDCFAACDRDQFLRLANRLSKRFPAPHRCVVGHNAATTPVLPRFRLVRLDIAKIPKTCDRSSTAQFRHQLLRHRGLSVCQRANGLNVSPLRSLYVSLSAMIDKKIEIVFYFFLSIGCMRAAIVLIGRLLPTTTTKKLPECGNSHQCKSAIVPRVNSLGLFNAISVYACVERLSGLARVSHCNHYTRSASLQVALFENALAFRVSQQWSMYRLNRRLTPRG